MPIIVYKTMSLTVCHAQVRRIACDHCSHPFCYVISDSTSIEVTGLPVVSSDEGMRQQVARQAESQLQNIATKSQRGQARCPHCQRYPSWMVTQSLLWNLIGWALGGLVAGGLLLMMLNAIFKWNRSHTTLAIAGAMAGCGLGLLLGKWLALKTGAYEQADSRSSSDEAFLAFVNQAVQQDQDPILLWHVQTGGLVPNEGGQGATLVSLGFQDLANPPLNLGR
jgi:hypothetical protein